MINLKHFHVLFNVKESNLMLEIENKVKEMGAGIIGYCDLSDYTIEGFENLKYGISIGVALSRTIVQQINKGPTYLYFHHYRTINALIDQITLRCCIMLEEAGYEAIPIAASQTVHMGKEPHYSLFSHKLAAVRCGLGWIGRSSLFVSNKYGSGLRLGTILTNKELPVNKKEIELPGCGDCTKCVDSCPARAIKGQFWEPNCIRDNIFDANACNEYMHKNYDKIGRGSVCGICMSVCPYNKY